MWAYFTQLTIIYHFPALPLLPLMTYSISLEIITAVGSTVERFSPIGQERFGAFHKCTAGRAGAWRAPLS